MCMCDIKCNEKQNWIWCECRIWERMHSARENRGIREKTEQWKKNKIEWSNRTQKNKNFSNYGKPEKLNKSGMWSVRCESVCEWLCGSRWLLLLLLLLVPHSVCFRMTVFDYSKPTDALFTSIHTTFTRDSHFCFFSANSIELRRAKSTNASLECVSDRNRDTNQGREFSLAFKSYRII